MIPQVNLLGEIDYNLMNATRLCEVSPDGFYLYPYFLLNKGFYQYTRFDTEGKMNYKKPSEEKVTFGSYQGTHFTTENKVFGLGNQDCRLALKNFDQTVIYCYQEKNLNPPIFTDSSQDGKKIAMIGVNKIYLFFQNQKLWQKDVLTNSGFLSTGITPGGKYVIYSTYNSTVPYRQIKIVTDNNIDKTPSQSQKGKEEDVVYVAANDKGIFYVTQKGKKLRLYQVGQYSREYEGETYPTPTRPDLTKDISLFKDGRLEPLPPLVYNDLIPGLVYYANQSVSFYLNDLGTVRLTQGTIFGVDKKGNPVLLKGQITADFNSPIKIYAIKFDRYDLGLFEIKLNQFINDQLDEEQYFEIKNVHTKFIVKNEAGKINVAVEKGEVEVKGKNLTKKVISGKQIVIDKKNNIKESVFIPDFVIKILIVGVLIISIVLTFCLSQNQNCSVYFKNFEKIFLVFDFYF